ncbi:MAG: hypothetical protein U9P79_09545 [Candidatus Cloacimonadota bacterium]|nr:hypothetical protein [Candidatus Cloacimonadota bacterium]
MKKKQEERGSVQTLVATLKLGLIRYVSCTPIFEDISRVHDQISLPAGDVTPEELLLKQRELETQYTYWGSIGLTYSFGSIYNNIVNPRFGN